MDDFEFEDAIRHALKEHAKSEGIVFAEVAEKVGISRSSLSTFLNSRNKSLTLSKMVAIADGMGLEPVISFRRKG